MLEIFFFVFPASTERRVSIFWPGVYTLCHNLLHNNQVRTCFSEHMYVTHDQCTLLGGKVVQPGCAKQVAYYQQVRRGEVGRQSGGSLRQQHFPGTLEIRADQAFSVPEWHSLQVDVLSPPLNPEAPILRSREQINVYVAVNRLLINYS